MTLVKNKPKVSSAKRKVSAGHHRHNRSYLKTYWPYIPILSILVGSLVANQYLPLALTNNQLSYSGASTRFASLTGIHSHALIGLLSLLLVLLVVYYAFRHFKRLRKLILNSEKFLARHYVLDILLALLIGSLYLLVR